MATQVSLTDGAVASAGALAIQTNGTTQAVSISTGQVATLAQNPILTSGTANGVAYLNGSKAVTSGSALTFDGTNFATTGTASATKMIPTGGSATGNGMYLPASNTLAWSNNGSETMRLDSAGNLGLGVTPSATTGSGVKGFEIGGVGDGLLGNGGASAGNIWVTCNTYFSSGFKKGASGYATMYNQSGGTHNWNVSTTSGGAAGDAITFTQAMTLDASGGLKTLNTIGVGNTTPSTSGAGITFPATQSASSDANTLDDYEEGTWTPTATSAIGSLTSYTSSGQYTKVGRMVYVIGNVYITNAGTASGVLNVAGLPFTTLNTTARPAVPLCREDQSTGVIYGGYVNINTTSLVITTNTGGGVVWSANYNYSFCFTYQAA